MKVKLLSIRFLEKSDVSLEGSLSLPAEYVAILIRMTTDKLQLFSASGSSGGRIYIGGICVARYCGNILPGTSPRLGLGQDLPVDRSISKSAPSQTRSISEKIMLTFC